MLTLPRAFFGEGKTRDEGIKRKGCGTAKPIGSINGRGTI